MSKKTGLVREVDRLLTDEELLEHEGHARPQDEQESGSPEMSFRKSISRAGLEVSFERIGLGVIFKTHDHYRLP